MTARKTPARKPRTTRTRAEVTNEFEEIQAQVAGAEALDPQASLLEREHTSKTLEAVKGLNVEGIVAKSAALGLEVGRTLSNLTEQCVSKATELQTIQDAVELKKNELETLHKLDVGATSIQILIEEHNARKAEFEKEVTQLKSEWHEEQLAHTKAVRERDAELAQIRRRDEDQYEYAKKQQRARIEDEFNQKIALAAREHAFKEQEFERELAQKRALIDKEEQEIAALKARVAGIETEIDKEAKRQVAIATNSLKKELENQHLLATKDLETKLQLEQQKSASLNEANAKLAEQVLKVTAQLEAARDQVQVISVKALESASGQVALTKVQETVASRDNGSGGKGGRS
jgi:hypothetical protein